MILKVFEDNYFSIERPHKNENVNGNGSRFFLLYVVVFSTTYENSVIENSTCIRIHVVDTKYN